MRETLLLFARTLNADRELGPACAMLSLLRAEARPGQKESDFFEIFSFRPMRSVVQTRCPHELAIPETSSWPTIIPLPVSFAASVPATRERPRNSCAAM